MMRQPEAWWIACARTNLGQDDTTRCGLVVALFKKIRMSASPHKDYQPRFVAVIELVGQKKVAAGVTFSMTGPLATQGVVHPFWTEQ